MNHIPLHEAVGSMRKGERSMKLLKSFFDAHMALETDIDSMWRLFANKWQMKLMDLEEDPLFQSTNGTKTLSDILRLLTTERENNTVVCCSVKSLLQRKRNSSTALLEKWISDYDDSTVSNIEEYDITYKSAVETMSGYRKQVTNSKRVLDEKVEKLEGIDKKDPTQNLMAALMAEEVNVAVNTHRQMVDECTRGYTEFSETMKDLQEFLREHQTSRMNVIQESLQKYMKVRAKYDEQRISRKQHLLEAEDKLANFSSSTAINDCLSLMLDPIKLPDYEMDFITTPIKIYEPKTYQALKKFKIPSKLFTIKEEKEKEEAAEQQWEKDMKETEQEETDEEETEQEETDEEETGQEETDEEETEGEEKDGEEEASEEEEEEAGKEEGEEEKGAEEEEEEMLEQKEVEKEAAALVEEEDKPVLVDVGDTTTERVNTVVYAVCSYTPLLPEHLSLSLGQKVYEVIPSGSNGLCFGYSLRQKWPWSKKKKTYGYYPGKLVIPRPPPLKTYQHFLCCFNR